MTMIMCEELVKKRLKKFGQITQITLHKKGRSSTPFTSLFFYDFLKKVFHFINIVRFGKSFAKTVV